MHITGVPRAPWRFDYAALLAPGGPLEDLWDELEILADAEISHDIHLSIPTLGIRGRETFNDGEAVSGTMVQARHRDYPLATPAPHGFTSEFFVSALTTEEGSYSIDICSAGAPCTRQVFTFKTSRLPFDEDRCA